MDLREVDKLIAENVFNIAVTKGCWFGGYRDWRGKMVKARFSPKGNHYYCGKKESLSKYSSDIKAAWEVIEKMIDNKFIFDFTTDTQEKKHKFAVGFSNGNCNFTLGNSAPLVICLAALKALGVDYED